MKARSLYLLVLLAGYLCWSCNKSTMTNQSGGQVSLKSALTTSVQSLTTAVNQITTSSGYQVVLGPSDLLTKSATISPFDTITHGILLANITGIYNYKDTLYRVGRQSIMHFFTKSKDTTIMVVRLPVSKVLNSHTLLHYLPGDRLLANDYVINLTDYSYTFKHHYGYDYRMATTTKIKGVSAGSYKIKSSRNKTTNALYSAEYDFPNGYIAKITYSAGDSAVSDYSISNGTSVLFEEKYLSIRNDSVCERRETNYALTIGNVMIVRQLDHGKAMLDSAKVYLNGILQLNAKVTVLNKTADKVDNTLTGKRRDLQITFEDGTTATLSSLANAAIPNINVLFTSLRQANFATSIVDWIAWDIYSSH